MGSQRRLRAHARRRQALVRHPAAAPQRDRHAAHGPCLPAHHHGCAGPLPPHEGREHALGAGHRPRRHRDPDRRRAAAAGCRPEPARSRPRRLLEARVGLEGDQRLDHHPPDAPHGRLGGLEARVLHDGFEALEGGHRHLRAALRRRPDLPRQASGELGPGAAFGGLRPRGGQRRARRHDVAHPLSVQRRPAGRCERPADARNAHRHHPARDHAGRRRIGRPPRRRALQAPGRPLRRPAALRPSHPHHHRRLRRPGLRLGLREDHRRARFQRLSGGAETRPATDHHLHPRREDQRQRPGRLSRPRSLRRSHSRTAGPRGARLPREGGAAQARSAHLRAHRPGRRADAHRAVVRGHDQTGCQGQEPGRPGDGGGGERRRSLRARPVGQHLQPLDEQHPGLDHLAPALVGPPDPGLVRQRWRDLRGPQRRRRPRQGRGCRLHGHAEPRPRRARHLVFVGPGALLLPGLARADRGAQALPAFERARDRLRHHLLLGRPDDDDDVALHRPGAVSRRLHPRPGARCPGQADEQVGRQRARPGRPHRRHRSRAPARQALDRPAPARDRAHGAQEHKPPSSRTASPASAPTPCASPSARWPAWAATSTSTASAARAIATSATSSGTRPLSC